MVLVLMLKRSVIGVFSLTLVMFVIYEVIDYQPIPNIPVNQVMNELKSYIKWESSELSVSVFITCK